jgi:hypothetical protein
MNQMQQANSGQTVIGLAHTNLHGCSDKCGWDELRYVETENRSEIQFSYIINAGGCCHETIGGLEI